jgi:hypothetical protein
MSNPAGGVISDHAERLLGHAIPGVEGVYDRHSYADEKRLALAKLAALIDSIVNPNASARARADQPAKAVAELFSHAERR